MSENHLYFIAAGGTGIRVALALLHCCAYGALKKDDTLHILVMDADYETNIKTIWVQWNHYVNLRKIFQEGDNAPKSTDLFAPSIKLATRPKIKETKTGSGKLELEQGSSILDVPPNYTIGRAWDYAKVDNPDKLLLKALLCDYQVNELCPNKGLYGCPALGALMLGPSFDGDVEITDFLAECKHKQVAMCASSFGGTGVAALECLLSRMEPSKKAIILLPPYFTTVPKDGAVWDDEEATEKHEAANAYFKKAKRNAKSIKVEPPKITEKGARWTRGIHKDFDQCNWPEETEWRAAVRICTFFLNDTAWRDVDIVTYKDFLRRKEAFAKLAKVWLDVFENSIEKPWSRYFTNAMWTLPMPTHKDVGKRECALSFDLPDNPELMEFFIGWQQWHMQMQQNNYPKLEKAETFSEKEKKEKKMKKYWRHAKNQAYDSKAKLIDALFMMIWKELAENG